MELVICRDDLIERVIGAAIEVHRELGPGLLESVYEQALMFELSNQDIAACNQVEGRPITKDTILDSVFGRTLSSKVL